MVLDAVCKRIVTFFTSTDSRRRSLNFSPDHSKSTSARHLLYDENNNLKLKKASFMMGIHPFLVPQSISVSMHLLVQRLFLKLHGY